jgi:DNA recombination protein RmuC
MTTEALVAGIVVALLAGLLGSWIRGKFSQQAYDSAQAEMTLLRQRIEELARDLGSARTELVQIRGESAARAGFESLAAERLSVLSERSTQLESVARQLEEKDREILRLTSANSQLSTDLANEQGNGEHLTHQFKVLANEILRENSAVFTLQNKTNLSEVLSPLTKDLGDFRQKVEAVERDNVVGRTQLSEQLKGLASLNQKLSDEAHNLATALRRDTKAQGNWGEVILLDILENSGLKKGEHFTFQQSFMEESGEDTPGQRRQTDVVVKLPEGRHLIIDSKVSINAYNDFVKAADDQERKSTLKGHLASVRKHYVDLADRNYHRLPGIQSPDFVVMFVPIEPAFMLALQEDDGLWLDAYKRGVLLAGPTTVLFVVRIVENLWHQEKQARNVQKVIDRGEKLYDKFVGFVGDLETVGSRINDADLSYKEAFKKLTSGRENLIRQVEMLREISLKPKKRIRATLLEVAGVGEEDEILPLLAAEAEIEEGEPSER